MTSPTAPPQRIVTDPAQLSTEERGYYRTTWGFDPVDDCQELDATTRRYEACVPLARDQTLHAAGVAICARVDWRGQQVHNRIVFRRGGEGGAETREAAVECTHTVVYAGPAGDALNLAADIYTARDRLDPTAWEMVGRAGGPVALPPWEHFAALKSYVTAIAVMGLLAILRHSIHATVDREEEVPFGFNAALRNQVVQALRAIATDVLEPFLHDTTAELVESTPADVILCRWEILNREGALVAAFSAMPSLLSTWMRRWLRFIEAGETIQGTGTNLLIAPEVATQLTRAIVPIWRDLVQALGPTDITRLCRSSNLLDGLQDHIFGTSESEDAAREFAPEVPWQQLRLEWRARRDLLKYVGNLDVTNENSQNPEGLPHAEIFPRGLFCERQLLTPFTSQFPDLNTKTAVHQRLLELGAKLSKDDVEWIFVKDHPRLREEMDEEYHKNMMLARDPHTAPEILENLARMEDKDVINDELRQLVASHPATPPSALEHLSNVRDQYIRLAIMAHPATPASVLKKLTQEKEISLEQVKRSAKCELAGHPRTPDIVLDRLAADEDLSTRGAVAGNSRTPPAILKRLSLDEESIVRKRVAENPTTPRDVIELLKEDADHGVCEVATKNLVSMPAQMPEANGASTDQFINSWREWCNGKGTFPTTSELRHVPLEYVNEVTGAILHLGAHITRTLAKKVNDPRVLNALAHHWDLPTKLAVAGNPGVSQEILKIMTRDIQPSVRAIADARLRRFGNAIDPFPGEILTPGEILWLLVSREGNEIALGADRRGDFSPAYAAWITSFRGEQQSPHGFLTYKYEAGIIRDYLGWDRFRYTHLALDGLRDLVMGQWPCLFAGWW